MTRAQKKRLERLEARRPRALPAEDPAEIHRKACERFGVPYRHYCELVPRFVPRRRPVGRRDLRT